MRLIAWNCQMAFRRKFQRVEALKPDILVISESESPEFLRQKGAQLPWPNHLWIGDNRSKGLSVFARDGYSLRLKKSHDPAFRFVVPVDVTGPDGVFDLYALWTQGDKTPSKAYVTHALNAARKHRLNLTETSVLAGDFNSNPVFIPSGKRHLELVDILAFSGHRSIYHRQNDEAHGRETTPTFYLHRNRAKPYHLDYVFCHETRPANLTVGAIDDWLVHSDHLPLIADLAAPKGTA